MEYYYNNTPEYGLVRNNLIYTSLISKDKKIFCQWYHNDTDYHKGMNQIIDPELMEDKWNREVKYLSLMNEHYPELVPEILEIDYITKKIFLKIDGPDFWQQHYDNNCTYDKVLPDWQDQMIEIFKAHKSLNFYKYSLHPSSYFIVNNRLKSINYFFCHSDEEELVPLKNFKSHISDGRQSKLEETMAKAGITWDSVLSYNSMQFMAFESFKSNYPDGFIERAKGLYVS